MFVYFENGKQPTRQDIEYVLTDFFNGLSKGPPEWKNDRFFLYLHGVCGHPLKRVLPENMAFHWKHFEEQPWPRWIEVWVPDNDNCIDVMTRHSDPATNALARAFAHTVALWWDGRIDED
jgi:hypothetical protein